MANHPSAEKRDRQRIRRTERNRSVKAAVRTFVKKARTTIGTAGAKKDDVAAAVLAAVRSVDKAASKGAVHPKKAARTKARLARAAHKAAVAKV
jgi:small subunit ribosomal protein S20